MDKLSVVRINPDLAKKIRDLQGTGKKPEPPFFAFEERDGTGKATCRACGEPIGEGEGTFYFEHADDHKEKPWLRTRGLIHADECDGGDWVPCPRCKKDSGDRLQVPPDEWSKHWREHRFERAAHPFSYREAAPREDIERRDGVLAQIPPEHVPSYHDPASSLMDFDDGYKVVPVKTIGDAKYEGEMMSHCLARFDGFYEGPYEMPPMPDAHELRQNMPEATDDMIEHMTSRSRALTYSLRDDRGLPKATWWEPRGAPRGTVIREMAGFANTPLKPKYEHRIRQYLRQSLEDQGLSQGQLEHIGTLREGGEGEQDFTYKPIQTLQAHELPTREKKYQGQDYSPKTPDGTVAKPVRQIGIDVPLVGDKQPKSIKDTVVDFVNDISDKVINAGPKDDIDMELPAKKPKLKDITNEFLAYVEGPWAGFKSIGYAKDLKDGIEVDQLAEHLSDEHNFASSDGNLHDVSMSTLQKMHDADPNACTWRAAAKEGGVLTEWWHYTPALVYGLDEVDKAVTNKAHHEYQKKCCDMHATSWVHFPNKAPSDYKLESAHDYQAPCCDKPVDAPVHDDVRNVADAYVGWKERNIQPITDKKNDLILKGLDAWDRKFGATEEEDEEYTGLPEGYHPRVDVAGEKARENAQKMEVDNAAGMLYDKTKAINDKMAGFRSVTEVKVSASPFRKEFKNVKDYAEANGWRVDPTDKGWMFRCPPDQIREGFNGIVITHGSPSDHRAFKNFLGDLKNHGGLIWPPERAKQQERKKQQAEEPVQLEHDPVQCLQENHDVDVTNMSESDIQGLHSMAHEDDLQAMGSAHDGD